jgi:hypothetical protein
MIQKWLKTAVLPNGRTVVILCNPPPPPFRAFCFCALDSARGCMRRQRLRRRCRSQRGSRRTGGSRDHSDGGDDGGDGDGDGGGHATHRPFGANVIKLGYFIRAHRHLDPFDLLGLIDERFAALDFHSYHGGVVLAEALAYEAEGSP